MTLTEISYYFRKKGPLIFLGFILLVGLYLAGKNYLAYLESKRPKPLITSPIFGKIPPIKASPSSIPTSYLTETKFILDNIEGIPTTATQTAKVFFLPTKASRFGYLQNIYFMARILGFNTEVTSHKIENKEAIFQDKQRKFNVDITNFNFTYEYDYKNNDSVFANSYLPDEKEIREKAKQLLRILGRYPEELAQGIENVIFLKYDPQTKEFVTVKTKEEANTAEINFFRPSIEYFPTLSPKYFTSHNYIVLTFPYGQSQTIKAQIQFFEKEDFKFGVYPLKTGDEAWDEVKQKKNLIIASLGKDNSKIVIKKMFLGYYDPDFYQEYLQPIYVFLDNTGFVGYMPAVKEDHIEFTR